MAMGLFYYGLRDTTATYYTNFLNIIPLFTFVFSILFRMEKLGLGSRAGKIKTVGVILCMGGALTTSLYKGKAFYLAHDHHVHTPAAMNVSKSHWTRGTFMLVGSCLCYAIWYILQEKLKEVLSQHSSILEQSRASTSLVDEVFIEVMGKEHPGSVRGLGLGPTPTKIWGLSSRHFQSMNDRDEEVLKLQEKLDAMTNKVSTLEEKAAGVSELEEKVSKVDELEATLATLKKVNVELVKFANAMQRRFSHVPSMDINSASLAVGSRQVKTTFVYIGFRRI